jgi:hypothetical protein
MNEPRDWAEQLQEEDLQTLSAIRLMLSSAIRSGSADELELAAQRSLEELRMEITRLRHLAMRMREREALDSAPI